jgi:hypothetical protein
MKTEIKQYDKPANNYLLIRSYPFLLPISQRDDKIKVNGIEHDIHMVVFDVDTCTLEISISHKKAW